MGETDFKELYDDIFSKYSDLHKEYLYLCKENQKLTEKLERLESDKVYAGERNEELYAKVRHFEMMFNDAERSRQILAAQMDVVYLIFGKKN